MRRRHFLMHSGLAIGAAAIARPALARQNQSASPGEGPSTSNGDLSDWNYVRKQFDLDPNLIHMSGFFLASHPRAVREAIERHRAELDRNPIGCKQAKTWDNEMAVLNAAAKYLGARPVDIALTDSTTMGLSIMYGTIKVREGQEILTTTHDHYSTWRNLQLRAERTGAKIREIPLYANSASTSVDEILSSLNSGIMPATRVVAVTWVHSSTGVKLPIRAMADAIAKVNAKRGADDRIIFCVDGVHGLGIEDVTLPELGCDFFVGGTHKWIFGPRGTGILWGRPESQNMLSPLIPSFSPTHFRRGGDESEPSWGMEMTPGGFHSFEHRWALSEAFDFHMQIGKKRVQQRIHELNRQLKEGLAKMQHVTLHTPRTMELSAGIVCFEVNGLTPSQAVDRLAVKKIVASVSPYDVSYARLAPSLLVTPEQVEVCLREVAALA